MTHMDKEERSLVRKKEKAKKLLNKLRLDPRTKAKSIQEARKRLADAEREEFSYSLRSMLVGYKDR